MGRALSSLRSFRLLDYQHTLGWFLLTVGTLGLSSDLYFYGIANIPYLVLLGAGIWLLVRNTNIFDESETKQVLRERHHTKVAINHAQPSLEFASWHAGLILVGGIVLSILLVLLFQYQPTAYFFVLLLVSAGLFALFFKRHTVFWLLLSSCLTLLSLIQVNFCIQNNQQIDSLTIFILVGAVAFGGFLVTALTQQKLESYRIVALSLGIFSLAYVGSWVQLSGLSVSDSFVAGLLSLTGLAWTAGVLAWIQAKRFSYAKYLGVVGAIAGLLYVYLFWGTIAITTAWLTGAVLLIAIGFLLPSYSLRMTGLISLAVSVLYYLVAVVNEPVAVEGGVWTHPQVWLGLSLMAVLAVTWWWYGISDVKGKEKLLYPHIRSGLLAALLGSGLAILLSQLSDGWLKITITLAIALAFCVGAERYRNIMSLVAGMVLILFALLQCIIQFSLGQDSARLLLFLALAILLLPGAFLLNRRN